LEEKGKAHIIRRIQRAEMMSQVFNKIKFIRQTGHTKGLTTLKIPHCPTATTDKDMKNLPDNDETWQTIRLPEEIKELLLERN